MYMSIHAGLRGPSRPPAGEEVRPPSSAGPSRCCRLLGNVAALPRPLASSPLSAPPPPRDARRAAACLLPALYGPRRGTGHSAAVSPSRDGKRRGAASRDRRASLARGGRSGGGAGLPAVTAMRRRRRGPRRCHRRAARPHGV